MTALELSGWACAGSFALVVVCFAVRVGYELVVYGVDRLEEREDGE